MDTPDDDCLARWLRPSPVHSVTPPPDAETPPPQYREQLGRAIACAGSWGMVALHAVVVFFVVCGALFLPMWLVRWQLGLIPLITLSFMVLGECPLSTFEQALNRRCGIAGAEPLPLLPARPAGSTPLTPNEQAIRRSYLTRFAYRATGVELLADDTTMLMVLATIFVHMVYMFRSGQLRADVRRVVHAGDVLLRGS